MSIELFLASFFALLEIEAVIISKFESRKDLKADPQVDLC